MQACSRLWWRQTRIVSLNRWWIMREASGTEAEGGDGGPRYAAHDKQSGEWCAENSGVSHWLEDALLSRFPFRSLLNAFTASSLLSGPHQAEFISSVQKLEINLEWGSWFALPELYGSVTVCLTPRQTKTYLFRTCVSQWSLRWCIWWIHLLEFGPAILVSRSWICLTSREMCCRRSLFCSSSWWTRAWASSRAVASALSWSFNRWTCRWGHI